MQKERTLFAWNSLFKYWQGPCNLKLKLDYSLLRKDKHVSFEVRQAPITPVQLQAGWLWVKTAWHLGAQIVSYAKWGWREHCEAKSCLIVAPQLMEIVETSLIPSPAVQMYSEATSPPSAGLRRILFPQVNVSPVALSLEMIKQALETPVPMPGPHCALLVADLCLNYHAQQSGSLMPH